MEIYIENFIKQVRGKLEAENVDIQDFDACIKVLDRCVGGVQCIKVYKDFIYSYNT